MKKVFVLVEGLAGSTSAIVGVFPSKKAVRSYMRSEFPKATGAGREFASELYWEDDDGFWWRADEVAFFKEAK